MAYTDPVAGTVYLASEMGWMLTTGFDKDDPTLCKKRCPVRNNNSGKQQRIGNSAICK
jgi:hypothetical protein